MDINITDMVSTKMASLTKTASKDSVSNAQELIANLSTKGSEIKRANVIAVLQNLISDINELNKREKVASLVTDKVNSGMVDEYDTNTSIDKLSSMSIEELAMEKKAFGMYFDNATPTARVFDFDKSAKAAEQGVKKSLQEHLRST